VRFKKLGKVGYYRDRRERKMTGFEKLGPLAAMLKKAAP
jgi:hypothetical protein